MKRDAELEKMIGDWVEYLTEPDDDEMLCQLGRETHSGRPLGADEFVRKLEKRLKRNLTRQLPGRPKKKRKKGRTR